MGLDANEHQSRVTASTHLLQNNASEPCFLTPFAKIYWLSSIGLRHIQSQPYDLYSLFKVGNHLLDPPVITIDQSRC